MVRVVQKGTRWEIVTQYGSIEIPVDQAQSVALQLLAGTQRSKPPLVYETRAQRVLRLIQSDLVTGEFRPGQRLDETLLASRYGVSRTPIREALTQLASTGLVIKESHKGCRVAGSAGDEGTE